MSKLKKYVEENKTSKAAELEIIDRGVTDLTDAPGLCKLFCLFIEIEWVGHYFLILLTPHLFFS